MHLSFINSDQVALDDIIGPFRDLFIVWIFGLEILVPKVDENAWVNINFSKFYWKAWKPSGEPADHPGDCMHATSPSFNSIFIQTAPRLLDWEACGQSMYGKKKYQQQEESNGFLQLLLWWEVGFVFLLPDQHHILVGFKNSLDLNLRKYIAHKDLYKNI